MTCKSKRCFAVLAASFNFAQPAFAAHPLQTEDTATQGAGNVEIENGVSRLRARNDGSTVTALQVQLSYGLTPVLDVLVQPSWLATRSPDAGSVRGRGDTDLGFKWRFHGEAPLSFGIRAGVLLPTSQNGLGARHGRYVPHAVLVATYDSAPFTLNSNLGYTHASAEPGQRRHLGNASAALMWAASESLTLSAEASADSDTDAARRSWPVSALLGVIYTVRPGLDLDMGYQSVTRSSQPSRSWLLGLTYRFAL